MAGKSVHPAKMHLVDLEPHPSTPAAPLKALRAGVRLGESLRLRFSGAGEIRGIRLPLASTPHRRDGLWKTTCFEAFLKPVAATAYLEFNFSPSGEWAAYSFDDRRMNMQDHPVRVPPNIRFEENESSIILDVELACINLPFASGTEIAIGLTAVIEALSGETSYWALAHRSGKPDFHDPTSFLERIKFPEAT